MINNVTARTSATASSATTSTDFATPAPIYTKNDVDVYVDAVKKTVDSHYTVTIASDNTANVNFTTGNVPADDAVVVIVRSLAYKQEQNFINNDALDIENVETGLDKLTIMSQQLSDGKDYSFKFAKELPASEFNSDTIVGSNFTTVQDRATTVTTGKTDRANKILSFKSNGDLEAAQEIGTYKGSDATTTTAAYVVRDLVKSTTAGQLDNVYICIKASPSGTALTNTTYWTLIVDAYSAASASQTATTKAGEASTSASNAASSESNAASSESNALSYKDSAESAKTAAETAQTAAEYAQTAAEDHALDWAHHKLTSNLTIDAGEFFYVPHRLDLNEQTITNNGTLNCKDLITGTGTITGSSGIIQSEIVSLIDSSLSSPADGHFLVHNGTAWVNEAPATARTSIGLGNVTDESKATMFSSPDFTGTTTYKTGSINFLTISCDNAINRNITITGL